MLKSVVRINSILLLACVKSHALFANVSKGKQRIVMQAELDKVKFFARPKLGLDCVGGASTLRLSDALAQVILDCFSWT